MAVRDIPLHLFWYRKAEDKLSQSILDKQTINELAKPCVNNMEGNMFAENYAEAKNERQEGVQVWIHHESHNRMQKHAVSYIAAVRRAIPSLLYRSVKSFSNNQLPVRIL